MLSLQNLCKQAVLKFGIATDKLPILLLKNFILWKKKIDIDFTGLYVNKLRDSMSPDDEYDWTGGLWSFTPVTAQGGHHPTMEIKAGEESHLGIEEGAASDQNDGD
eukprot:GFUD01046320.1.p1 GENE.GFUD01046320.1~~GFUD01046320.1.p1  ORF type:complete len:106 (+),score=22.14 GFUD01046320.1:72-389(+)